MYLISKVEWKKAKYLIYSLTLPTLSLSKNRSLGVLYFDNIGIEVISIRMNEFEFSL